MTTSEQGIDLIQHFEKCFLKAYQCPAMVWTIGWGTIEYPDGRAVKQGNTCTQLEADLYMQTELAQKERGVLGLLGETPISQPQFDALVSFAYNLGTAALAKSTLLKRILENPTNEKDIIGSDNMSAQFFGKNGQFLRWINVKGKPSLGLIRRRKAEAWLYSTGVNRFFEEIVSDRTLSMDDYI